MALQSKQLVATQGVLATPNIQPGKVLPTAVERRVTEFYLSDSVSCMMPGKKEYVSMLVEGRREHVGFKVGLTKFKELRPKNVVLAGASGTHNVCVCKMLN